MKNKIAPKETLSARIRELELLEEQQMQELKGSLSDLGDSVNPVNLFRNAMHSVVTTPGLRTTAIDTAVSLGAGFLSRKLVVRKSGNIFRKIAGTAVQFLVTNLVRNKMPEVKEKIIHPTNGVGKH